MGVRGTCGVRKLEIPREVAKKKVERGCGATKIV